MGFMGFKNFFNELSDESEDEFLKRESLIKLKLVVDGNQLPYIVNSLIKQSEYGGNYNELYIITKKLLKKLEPVIEVVIFHGPEYDDQKNVQSYKDKILAVNNMLDGNKPDYVNKKNLERLESFPAMFTKMIIYEVLQELDIYYLIAEEDSFHTIACYANGRNRKETPFTLLGNNSSYYAYNLEKGYLTWTSLMSVIEENIEFPLSRNVPVFYLSMLLDYYDIKQKTWIFFCIISGNYANPLKVKKSYMKENNLDSLSELFFHLRRYESNLINTNYRAIRNSYKDESIDELNDAIAKYTFNKINHGFIDSDGKDEFSRLIEGIKNTRIFHYKCCLEDLDLKSCFMSVFYYNIEDAIYTQIAKKNPKLKIKSITERIREPDLSRSSGIFFENTRYIKAEDYCKIFNYLKKRNNYTNSEDSSTLFFAALSIWFDYMKETICHDFDCFFTPLGYVDAVITNLLLINVCEMRTNVTFSKFLKQDYIDELVDSYDETINNFNLHPHSRLYAQIIHRLSEFQAIYYALGLLNRAAEFDFKLMSISLFFNGQFITNYMRQEREWAVVNSAIRDNAFILRLKNDLMFHFSIMNEDMFGSKVSQYRTYLNNGSSLDLKSFLFAPRGVEKFQMFEKAMHKIYRIEPSLVLSEKFIESREYLEEFPDCLKIEVFNISKKLNEKDLKEFFSTFGRVLCVKLHRNHRSDRNIADILFDNESSAFYLIKKYENSCIYADINGAVYKMMIDKFIS